MKKYFLSLTFFLSAVVSYAQWEPDVQLTTNPYGDFGSFNNSKWIASQGSDVHITNLQEVMKLSLTLHPSQADCQAEYITLTYQPRLSAGRQVVSLTRKR